MNDPRALAAKFAQHRGETIGQLRREYAEHLVLRAGGICERAKQVEDCWDAQRGARGCDEFHGGVVRAGEDEAHVRLIEALAGLLRGELDLNAELFENVRGSD